MPFQRFTYKALVLASMILFTAVIALAEAPSTQSAGQSAETPETGRFWKNLKGQYQDIRSRFEQDQIMKGKVLKKGAIDEQARGQDRLHNGKGEISIVQKNGNHYVQTEGNFKISLAPDLYIYVSPVASIKHEDDFYDTKQISLGRLTKSSGANYYLIPSEVNTAQIQSVTIMCKRYRQYMASAELFPFNAE